MADEQIFNQMLEELKAIRETKKISLDSISQKFRIRLSYLRALEEGNLEQLPHVYDRFIFKTYLQALQVEDPQKYLARFDELRQSGKKHTTIFSAKNRQNEDSEEKEWISKPTLLKIFYAGIPVLILIVLIVVLMRNQSQVTNPSADETVQELTAQKIILQKKAEQSKEQRNISEQKARAKGDSLLRIVISAHADSWIRYVKDHADTSDFILKNQNLHQFYADSVVEFKIGNPAALTFKINSVTYDSLARPGQVIAYMKVTPRGIVALRAVFPKKRKVVKNDSSTTH